MPEKEQWDNILSRDEAQFLRSADEATGSFLKVGDDKAKAIHEFPEPITSIAMIYQKDLGPDEMVAELGLQNVQALETLIKANAGLIRLGLGVLATGARSSGRSGIPSRIGPSLLFTR